MLSQDICGRFFPILHQLESGKSCCEYLNGFSGLQSIISFHLCSPPLNPFFSKSKWREEFNVTSMGDTTTR
ncbi:unnamed protein product [Lactuca virosa]|uniref:Uncharacterized protein n=1 Tax=Lactuca virosa TaxID=75947 RepID=A0AAU9NG34_9ASTR|nr:unnamed protein product [Lactuca virosa]